MNVVKRDSQVYVSKDGRGCNTEIDLPSKQFDLITIQSV